MSKTSKMLFAVTLHNIPEGMAVGVVYAGFAGGSSGITAGAALALAIGIAIQNFPEGAIISMPLYAEGKNKPKSFILGVLSGAVEPFFGGLTVILAAFIVPAMPCLLSFAAGAMLYVVVEELIPEMSEGEHSDIGVIAFSVGFSLMMALDVALG
jgi:ZIP family zinc transporter